MSTANRVYHDKVNAKSAISQLYHDKVNAKSAISQLYHNKVNAKSAISQHITTRLMPSQQSLSYITTRTSYILMRWWCPIIWIFIALAHWNNSCILWRHVAQLWHILIATQSVSAYSHSFCVLSREVYFLNCILVSCILFIACNEYFGVSSNSCFARRKSFSFTWLWYNFHYTLISILNLTASILGFLKELSNQDKICDQRNIPVYLNKL